MKPVLFVLGPTGSGKSALAMALARKLNGEIISADSMQIYRGMDIGTAKPSARDQKSVPHHLINLMEPSKTFSAHRFYRLALCAVKDITKRGRLPIVVGGTGFYVRTLLYGLAPVLPGTNAVRKKLEHEAAQKGTGVLYDRLGMLDPERAAKIQKNDRQRILRALEILALTGEKPSELYRRHEHKFMAGFSPVLIGIRRNRADLYERINQRVDRMFKRGWMAETKKIMRKKVSHTAAQALGYREIHEVILGESDSRSARDVIKKKTRHFAKRQMTWFRKEQDVRWFDWAEGESVGAMSVQVAHWFRTTGLHGAK